MRHRVLAIGFDSAEPTVVEKYIDAGYLPTLRRLRDTGAYGRLENFDVFSAETPWTTFATGCSPQKLGYWSPLRLAKGRYAMETRAAYEYTEVPPFYALGDKARVAVFDVPQVRIVPGVNGIQVGAWGAHSPQVPSASDPAGLLEELTSKHGHHPGLHDDYGECLDMSSVERIRHLLPIGIQRRADICVDLLQREPWDLFLTVFGEPHTVGHNMWQVSQPDHPLYDVLSSKVEGDPMREAYEDMDHAIARIVAAAGPEMRVIVFSAHGMGPNTMDLASMGFLPEFLYRYNFPGQRFIGAGDDSAPLPPPITAPLRNSWIWDVWANAHDKNPLRRWLRQRLPWGALKYIEPLFKRHGRVEPDNPLKLFDDGLPEVPFEPATWYRPFWPQMKAFALPSFSEGYVRLNVRGREPNGIVDPEDYIKVREEIIDALEQMRCGRSGEKMVRRVVRTRESALDDDPRLPDADIVLGWQETYATDVVESPHVGRIGPVAHYRAGSHRSEGFALAAGPGIAEGSETPRGHALDIAPTILSLMGLTPTEHVEGKPLAIPEKGVRAVPLRASGK